MNSPLVALLTIFTLVPLGIGGIFLFVGGIAFLTTGHWYSVPLGIIMILGGYTPVALLAGYVTGKWRW